MTITDEGLSLANIRNLAQAVERTPNGSELITLARKMRLWTDEAHGAEGEMKKFPTQFSQLGAHQLSNWASWFTSESQRVHELIGLLSAQERYQSLRLKQTKAQARGRIRTNLPEGTKVTVGELNDRAEEDPTVVSAEETLVYIQMLLDVAKAYRDSVGLCMAGISREITYRGDQLKAFRG